MATVGYHGADGEMIIGVEVRTATAEAIRRIQLHRLDVLLAELEALNLRAVSEVPSDLSSRLRSAGVGHPTGATVSTVIDLVFRAQERFLQPMPGARQRSRSAA
ncbi:MAG: hypothetical protein ACYDGR_17905 [Candidatus Dormibacteria bacterium]